MELAIRPKVHHHFAQNHAQTALLRRFEADIATVFVNGCVNHRGRRAIACQLMKEERRLFPRSRTGCGNQSGRERSPLFPGRSSEWAWHAGVYANHRNSRFPRCGRLCTMMAPLRRLRREPKSGASIKNPRIPNGLESDCIAERSLRKIHGIVGHGSGRTLRKGFGQRTRRNNKYEKRAAARIALTCLIRQRDCPAVRNIFGEMHVCFHFKEGRFPNRPQNGGKRRWRLCRALFKRSRRLRSRS